MMNYSMLLIIYNVMLYDIPADVSGPVVGCTDSVVDNTSVEGSKRHRLSD